MTAPKAYLLVFSELGPNVPESDFHDWYNNEHIPLRINTSTFSSWERWVQADGETPSWAASYDLKSFEATQKPPYTTLAETRSEREKDLLSKVEWVDRRIYAVYDGPTYPPSSLFDPKKSARVVVFIGLGVKPEAEEDFNKWYDEEHIPMLAKAPGWIRSRRFVLKDDGKMGNLASKSTAVPPPKYLAVHEWATEDFPNSEEYKAALDTPWRWKVNESITDRERRVMKFYKRFERQ